MNRPLWLRIIFIQALVASLWSLYLGFYGDPVLNLQTWDFFNADNALKICILCRYARILMYPLVFISGVALIRNDHKAWTYMIPSVVLGIILESYQYGMMIFPTITGGVCDPNNPCTIPYLNYFGFITIPLLCLIAFIVIGVMILRAISQQKQSVKQRNW